MTIEVGHVEALFRYRVKSMAGERLEDAMLGWHGIEGDRRLAFRKTQDRGGFPWLTATKLPELLRFTPVGAGEGAREPLPTHVRTPDGRELDVFGAELARDVEDRLGAPVEMMELRQGIFDDAALSVIAVDTIRGIASASGIVPDARRFRPNVLLRLHRPEPFQEDTWLGGVLAFGAGDGPLVSVTVRDLRCAMVNFDPDSAVSTPDVMKSVVRMNQNTAGVYGVCVRPGRLAVGQPVFLKGSD